MAVADVDESMTMGCWTRRSGGTGARIDMKRTFASDLSFASVCAYQTDGLVMLYGKTFDFLESLDDHADIDLAVAPHIT
jgi:hypothetical protein